MALTRAGLTAFYEDRLPYLEEIIGKFQEQPTIFRQFLNSKKVGSGWIDTNTVSGFGLFATKEELVDADLDDIIQGPVMRTSVLTYAKRHLVSQEAIEDEEGDGIIAGRLPEMLHAGRATQEVLAHDVLNSGFTTSIATPDGAALISAAHINLGGTTSLSNLEPALDLTETVLSNAVTTLQTQNNDRGIPIFQQPKTLVVSPLWQWQAQKLLKSALEPGSANNAVNPMSGQGIQLVVSPYLTDEDTWFLLADQHKLDWYDRVMMENWSKVDEIKSGVQIGARFRSATAAHDWRGICGSLGTA